MQYDESYAQYSMSNKFRDDNDALINDDLEGAEYCFTLCTREYGEFGVWQQWSDDGAHWVVTRKTRKSGNRYTYDYRLVDGDTSLLRRADDLTRKLLDAYSVGKVQFPDQQCKSEFGMLLGSLMQQAKTK